MSTTTPHPLADLANAVRTAAEKAGPSLVAIGRHGRGTGMVIAEGRVLTNAHNLRDRTTTVTFADGRSIQGRVLGTDPDHDLVVLDVDTADVAILGFATTGAPVSEGDAVFAAARTHRGQRVTFGLVSAVDRAFRGPRGRRVKGAVEHTAPLARGSSGGPLLDAEGTVIAINTHRLGEGFYLAQPADAALRDRVERLAAGTNLGGRRLGVAIVAAEESARMRRKVGLPDQAGLLVAGVADGSPAAGAGLDEGDLIVAVEGTAVASIDDVWDALDAAGDTVTLEVQRGIETRTVIVSFADTNSDAERGEDTPSS